MLEYERESGPYAPERDTVPHGGDHEVGWLSPDDLPEKRHKLDGMRAYAELAPTGILVATSRDSVVCYVNAACRSLMGTESQLLLGEPLAAAFPNLSPFTRDAVLEVVGSYASPSALTATSLMVTTVQTVDREAVDMMLTVWPVGKRVLNEREGAVVMQFVPTTHSSVKGDGDGESLEELRSINQKLVLAKLREQKLAEHAEADSRSKSAFLATMSHELRTPINAIIGYATLLNEGIWGPVQEVQHAKLARINGSARHLLALIEEVLLLSRMEARKEIINWEKVDSETLLDEAFTLTFPIAMAKRLTFNVHRPETPFVFQSDFRKVLQILVNLIGNAIKFTEQGSVTVQACMHSDRVQFSVSDTGVGIAANYLERIFDPFWQVNQRLSRPAGGTGLGLSVSLRLARLLGGDLTVESTPGQGSVFVVSFPLMPGMTGSIP